VTTTPPRIAVEGIGLAFGGVAALADVTMAVPPGEIRGIIGPNGAGKTSLLNVICGIVPPDSGRVRLDGRDVTGLSPSRIAALGLRRTFQTSALFGGLTVLENVAAGLHTETRAGLLECALGGRRLREEEREAAARARRALDFVGMVGFADRPAGALSFGQQRLVEIARALASEPRVVLLDEPAVGLSLNRLADIDRLLRRIRDERGVTLLLIEHVIRLVMEVSDGITVLGSGAVIAEGTPAAVRQDPAVVAAYLGTAVHA
jgi:branched-chain amino acid transport system ATP-binding protein